MNAPVDAGRLAPHSIEAEEAVLGSVLLDPEILPDVAAEVLPGDFFIVRNGWVYEALLAIQDRREQIDYLTVLDELRRVGRLDEIGGPAYITHLINNTPAAFNAVTYAKLVSRASLRRRMLDAASQIGQAAVDETLDVYEVVERSEAVLFQATERSVKDDITPLASSVSADMDRVDRLMQAGVGQTGLATKLTELDGILGGGFQDEDLILLAGRPGTGKTSLALTVALNVSATVPVGILSLEMSTGQLTQRFESMLSGVPTQTIRTGQLDDKQHERYVDAAAELINRPIYISDVPGLTPLALRSKARRMMQRYGVRLLIVDYLQLMTANGRENRVQEVSEISRMCKLIARELHVPVLALSQLSRAVEQRQDKRPVLADLRDSGSLEQDADVVLFIYRDELYNEATERPNQADVIVAKHRNGPTGTATLFFRKELTLFANLKREPIDLGGAS